MIKTRPIYVMASQTDTRIAHMIRAATHYPYNHISLTLDPAMDRWYSFARYRQDTPLYGGFIMESPARILGSRAETPVRIFRVHIPESDAALLETMLPLANRRDSGLIYNHLDALACAVGLRAPVPRCYTCLSFAEFILGREFHSIEKLCQALSPHEIYNGSLSGLLQVSDNREDAYYAPMGLLRGSSLSTIQLGRLLYRAICHGFDSYKAHFFRKTAS